MTGYFTIAVTTSASPNITSYAASFSILDPKGIGNHLSVAEQAFWGMAILITFVGMSLMSPVAALIGAGMGLMIIFTMGLVSALTLGILVIILIMIMFIAYKVQE